MREGESERERKRERFFVVKVPLEILFCKMKTTFDKMRRSVPLLI